MRLTILFGSVLVFALSGNADTATRFNCRTEGSHSLAMEIPSLRGNDDDEDEDVESTRRASFKFFDGDSLLVGEALSVHDRLVRVNIAGSSMIATLTLPRDLNVRRIQTGGYYFPVYTSYPVEFSTTLQIKKGDGEVISSTSLECIGR